MHEHGSVEGFQNGVPNFDQFAGKLSAHLTLCGDPVGGEAMATAESVYLQFVECDQDGSGDISIEEFVSFYRVMDMSEERAIAAFFRADVNGDGTRSIFDVSVSRSSLPYMIRYSV